MSALSNFFSGTACKYLSAVDTDPKRSNQHEIGSNKLTAILGTPTASVNKLVFSATFMYFEQDSDTPEIALDTVTFYDTRVGKAHRAPEYRLYYRSNPVTALMSAGDFCLISRRSTGEVLIAITPHGTDHERRLRYLFSENISDKQWAVTTKFDSKELDFASRSILDALGIETAEPIEDLLGLIVDKFGMAFPKTALFSAFARETMADKIDAAAQPDFALEEWMKQEERLFRTLEREIVTVQLKKGFESVEMFINFSLSVQNRRKSRVGHALENHLEEVFKTSGVRYQRGGKTEGNAKPDFLFPSAKEYHDSKLSSPPLQMLAAKSTCKDRWRQILAEAAKIPRKHLFTLETAISESQTTEMISHSVQLVVPTSVAKTYSALQQTQLMALSEFIEILPR